MNMNVGGGPRNPDVGDLAVSAGRGHGGKGAITMPGVDLCANAS